MYIATNASCIELTDIEKYVAETVKEKPFILWNMELDTLRADLGESMLSMQSLVFAHFAQGHICICRTRPTTMVLYNASSLPKCTS